VIPRFGSTCSNASVRTASASASGGDYDDRKDPDATRRKAVAQLRRLGFHVKLSKSG
jgi:hypothetical protein